MPFFTRPNFEDRQVVQYSGSSITLSGNTNIYPTGNFRIYKNAFPGLVATSLDADGTVGWGPISGISWSISACTSPLYVNNLVSCPSSGGTIQVDAGNLALNSELNFLIPLSAGTTTDNVLVIDSGGYIKSVPQSSITPIFTGGTGNCVTDLYVTNIHGCSPINIQPTSPDNVYLVNGGGNVGINVLTATTKLHVSGNSLFNADVLWLSTNNTTIIPTPTFKGVVVDQYFDGGGAASLGTAGIFTQNTSPSGNTGILMSNDIGVFGYISVPGSLDYRIGSPVTGEEFYRNKMVIKALSPSEGMIFNPSAGNADSTFWWEMDGRSLMILKGDGIDKGFLGLALNIDGTEMPTSTLQIGGTGTTGTFQYRDGNQQSGYVLTSDSDGNATWQPSTGGGSGTTIVQFTGNTSASCITNLWVTNVLGCSPVNVNNSLKANDNNTVEIDFISGKTDNTNTIDLNNGTYSDIKLFSKGAFSRDRYLSLSDDYLTVGATVLANGTDQYLALFTNSSSLYGQDINLISNYGQINSLSQGFNMETSGKIYGVKVNEGYANALLLTSTSLEDGLLNGEIITGKQHPALPTGQMRTGLGVLMTGGSGSEFYTTFLSTPRSITYNDTSYSTIWNNVIAAGSDHSIYTGVTGSFIGGGTGHTINPYVINSVILGGVDITATTSNTVYLGNNVNVNNAFTFPNVDGSNGEVLTTDGNGIVSWQPASNVNKYSTTSGFTGSVTKTITHNLGTNYIHVSVWDNSTGDEITSQVQRVNSNSVNITIATTGTYDIFITG